MPIGAAAGHEVELCSQTEQSLGVEWSMSGMTDFGAIEAVCLEAQQSLARSVAAGVSPNGQRTSSMRETDGVRYFEARLGHVSRTTSSEISIEGITMVCDVTRTYERARDVWAAERTARRFREDVRHLNRYSDRCQPLDYRVTPVNPLALKSFEPRAHRAGILDMKCEKVNLEIAIVRAKLTTAHYSDAGARACRGGLAVASDGVMIGYRNREQSRTRGRLDQFGG